MTSGVTRSLARFASDAAQAPLADDVAAHARRAVLDWLGSTIGGSLEAPARMVRAVVRDLGASDRCTVFPGEQAGAAGAALANGVAAHILELDDVHKGSTLHAAAPVIPAALAVAEREGRSGADFLCAVAVGYDAALRVGEAVNPSHYRFWHPTGTAATFGAAAAAGVLLRLDVARMQDALGSAGTQASGLWEFNADGAMSKHLHPGKAAMNGVLAADLAREGFTGATRILEGERGFFAATATHADPTRITDRLGEHWKIVENCYKLHACCGHTHSAIDVALEHRAAQGWNSGEAAGEALARVVIETYGPGYAVVQERRPSTPYQAKFSLAYCVAAALCDGEVGLAAFDAARFGGGGVAEPRLASLLKRIEVVVAPDLTARYPAEWGTRVTFHHRDGRTETRALAFPRGNPENPVDDATLQRKAIALLQPRVGERATQAAIAWVDALPTVPDMGAHTRVLGAVIGEATRR